MTETSDFVIARHKTQHKHYDLVLGMNGITRHWIVPNSIPKKFGEKRIAIEEKETPGFPPKKDDALPARDSWGEGTWEIWDEGRFEIEASSGIKLVIKSSGGRFKGRYLLLVPGWGRWTGKRLWIIEKIKER
ncbi:MAG TPA: DNA polymerase ligase N-terminal domain-containing protein [Thermodesulfobacteriota bacterium]|nr:DNA polymerase ligase N-terminal domain-containing protein [Thermodesulfobacteriota bacterium]